MILIWFTGIIFLYLILALEHNLITKEEVEQSRYKDEKIYQWHKSEMMRVLDEVVRLIDEEENKSSKLIYYLTLGDRIKSRIAKIKEETNE